MTVLYPTQVEAAFERLGIVGRFGKDEAEKLTTTTIVDRAGFAFFPTPENNDGLSIGALRAALGVDPVRTPCFFDHPWYLEEPFIKGTCEPGWHAIATDIVPNSVGQPIYFAEDLKALGLYLPSAVEMALMLFLHFAQTGEHLMLRKHTWTRDRTSGGRFVSVGAFGKKGLFVSGHEVGYASRGLGICPIVDPERAASNSPG